MKKIVSAASEKTYCGYIRPEPRNPAAKQRAAIELLDLGKFPIYEETAANPPGFPHRTAMVNARRKGCNDVVIVSEMHRLAPDAESLRAVLKQLRAKDASILEATTGRYSGTNGTMEEMVLDAVAWYRSKGLTSEAAAKLGKIGANASPMSRPLAGRMPVREAQIIWRNPALTTEGALNTINADERFEEKYSQSAAYRHLKTRMVGAGRPPKTKST
jgi:hypothetical protein